MTSRLERRTERWGGYVVPWFVALVDGKPDFRVIDTGRMREAVRKRLCMLCGEPLGQFGSFVIGPMCAVNRVSSEPPSHRDCGEYAARTCPFLSDPARVRRDGLPDGHNSAAGFGLKRNPGVTLVWTTKQWRPFQSYAGKPGTLWQIGPPTSHSWWACGRPATRDEVVDSIQSGLPSLVELAAKEGRKAMQELEAMVGEAMDLLPPRDVPAEFLGSAAWADTIQQAIS